MTEIEALYAALGTSFGLALRTTNAEAVRQRLYTARRRATDPQLNHIVIRLGHAQNEIWLLRSEHLPTNSRGRKPLSLDDLGEL